MNFNNQLTSFVRKEKKSSAVFVKTGNSMHFANVRSAIQGLVWFMVFNVTFNNISAMSCR
jgi:hypothetical protein